MAGKDMDDAFAGSVTVGERGQVVIPAEARKRLDIQPGEKLLAFCHPTGDGVFFAKLGQLRRFMEALQPLIEAHEDDDEADAASETQQ